MRTAIYIRVSTDEQVRDGYSIDAQKHKLKQYCDVRGWPISGIYIDEGISGKNIKDRPQLSTLLEDVKSGKINNVLVYKLDRLTRNTRDLIDLMDFFQEQKVEFNSVNDNIDTSSATGRMFTKMMGVFAEWERELISERMVMGKEQKVRAGGKNIGKSPYGYDYDKTTKRLVIIESEAEVIRSMYDMILKGKAYPAIVKYLNDNMIPTKTKDNLWRKQTIKRMLTVPLYCGMTYFTKNGKILFTNESDDIPPIISKETYDLAQRIISARSRESTRKHPKADYIFGDVLYCYRCQNKAVTHLSSVKYKNVNGEKVSYSTKNYSCPNRAPRICDQSMISATKLEKQFEEYFFNHLLKQLSEQVEEESAEDNREASLRKEIDKHQKRISNLLQEIDKIHIKKKRLTDKFINDLITADNYQSLINDYDNELSNIATQKKKSEEEIAALEHQLTMPNEDEKLRDVLLEAKEIWATMNNEEKRIFITTHIEKIYFDSGKIKEIYFY